MRALRSAVYVAVGVLTLATSATAQNRPEETVVNTPTTQSLRARGHYFRLTHRFVRNWRVGDGLAEDLFGLDQGAVMGLEYRYAPTGRTQLAVHRSTLFRTIQFSGRVDAWRQGERLPVAVSLAMSVEGTNNFRDYYAPALAAVVSRSAGPVSFYASPTVVWKAPGPAGTGHEYHTHSHEGLGEADEAPGETTFYAGIGARIQVRPSVGVAIEAVPRLAGFSPASAAWGAALEKQTRGHTFQLNFGNTFGTTAGQLARGGDSRGVYMGFNLVRRF